MTTEERFTRIETILEKIVDRQEQQDETLAVLVDSHIKTQEQIRELAKAQTRLAERQAETEVQLKALGLVVEATERQWQAYLNTIRPQ